MYARIDTNKSSLYLQKTNIMSFERSENELERTQSASIRDWARLSSAIKPNRTPSFQSFGRTRLSKQSNPFEPNGTEPNSIHGIVFDWVRQPNSIGKNQWIACSCSVNKFTWTKIMLCGVENTKNICYTEVTQTWNNLFLIFNTSFTNRKSSEIKSYT